MGHHGATMSPIDAIPPALEQTARDLDIHVAGDGWDQPTRLFAIADTQALLEREPSLAAQLSTAPEASPWTTIEQDGLPAPLRPRRAARGTRLAGFRGRGGGQRRAHHGVAGARAAASTSCG